MWSKILQEVYDKLAEILDMDYINDSDVLSDFEDWDSLAVITLNSYLDKQFEIGLYTSELQSLTTVGDLISLIKSKRA